MNQKTKKRFESKINKNTSNGCWEWLASLRGGYGQFKYRGTMKIASRLAWELYRDKIPKGKYVLHTCNNRKCVNPYHLYIGTQQDNIDDMIRRGRGDYKRFQPDNSGEKHGRAKLTRANVDYIRTEYRDHEVTQQELADEMEVSAAQICNIINYRRWN